VSTNKEAAMIYGLYHAPQETSGLIGDIIKELGLPFKDVHLYDGEGLPRFTSDLQGLVVMGGPMSVNDLTQYPFLLPEIQLIERLLAADKPVLGICLGAQLIARALGSRVYPNHVKELGWHPVQFLEAADHDPFLFRAPRELEVLHWHGETFDLPKGAQLMARSSRCENQAFRWGRNAYGFQFHFEVTPAMLADWCGCEDGQRDLDAAGEDSDRILTHAETAYRHLEPVARGVFTSYLKASYENLLPVA
jgi:GMP synthase-like glutamine amidotransferase